MAHDPAGEAISKVGAEHDDKYSANRERFEAQSWYEIDRRLMLLLAPLFRAGDDATHEATIELTVVVDGTIISGSVVSENAWIQRQNDQIRIGSPAIADALAAVESKRNEHSLEPAEDAEDAEANVLQRQNRYIHFLAPVLLSGGVHVRLPATRVDLRKVATWSIGRISLD
ncbi:hypothetical protein [Arthrobacter sp. W4I7]|uniref:hypothetical protein n=1 Tax=Arthrobacter sp. W4I7 TaxID=3042296 RepID=UPI0027860D74|nr:hypothetical protein [Arthrobacter sp. W4I7]MDQ0689284.1 hypothetical protein [Arthrobacter sp. W4I7]